MSIENALRFSRILAAPQPPAEWPRGIALLRFVPETSARKVHQLLVEGYANGGGVVEDYETWWNSLASDAEYDPHLVFTAFGPEGRIAGVAICWSTAFVKDVVVAPSTRRLGLASSLLTHAFATFAHLGAASVSLKVEPSNVGAIALYRSLGMQLTA